MRHSQSPVSESLFPVLTSVSVLRPADEMVRLVRAVVMETGIIVLLSVEVLLVSRTRGHSNKMTATRLNLRRRDSTSRLTVTLSRLYFQTVKSRDASIDAQFFQTVTYFL